MNVKRLSFIIFIVVFTLASTVPIHAKDVTERWLR